MADTEQTLLSRRKPSVGVAALGRIAGDRVRLEPLGFETVLNLRGRPADGEFVKAVASVFGVDLPLSPNAIAGSGEHRVFWLGPDEWLVVAPDGRASEFETRFRSACANDPWCAIVDVSNNTTGFTLAGPAARDVLAKGCPLDLHPRVFGPAQCAQSVLAGTRVLLAAGSRPESFELRVRNSFARYLVAWLADAIHEFSD